MSQKKKVGPGKVATAIGVGVGVVAAAAGAWFLYGTKQGKKERTKIKGWVLKMKGEILEKLEKLSEINDEAYNNAVDAVARGYEAVENVDKEELKKIVDELKGGWKWIANKLQGDNKKKATKKKSK